MSKQGARRVGGPHSLAGRSVGGVRVAAAECPARRRRGDPRVSRRAIIGARPRPLCRHAAAHCSSPRPGGVLPRGARRGGRVVGEVGEVGERPVEVESLLHDGRWDPERSRE